jgi:topoisomerase IV subunit A
MTLEDKEEVLRPMPVDGDWIAAASANGRLLWFPRAEMKVMARGRGVIVMGLDDKETLCAVACPAEPVVTVSGIGRGGKEIAVEVKGVALQACVGKRARKGSAIAPKVKPAAMS